MRAKARLRWWSLTNWLKGYKFGPVQRYRCCGHTTPYHYNGCENQTSESAPGATNAPESGLSGRNSAENANDRVAGSGYVLGPDGVLTEGFFVMNDDGGWEPWRP